MTQGSTIRAREKAIGGVRHDSGVDHQSQREEENKPEETKHEDFVSIVRVTGPCLWVQTEGLYLSTCGRFSDFAQTHLKLCRLYLIVYVVQKHGYYIPIKYKRQYGRIISNQ